MTLRRPRTTVTPSDDPEERLNKAALQRLQEALPAIEPPADVREAMLARILSRTVRSWREWLNRSRDRLDD